MLLFVLLRRLAEFETGSSDEYAILVKLVRDVVVTAWVPGVPPFEMGLLCVRS